MNPTTTARPERPEFFLGLDGCRGGWACIRLGRSGTFEDFSVLPALDTILHESASVRIWIDIPVGLPEKGKNERVCDVEARRLLGARRSSVFRVPVRSAVNSPDYRTACLRSEDRCGVRLSRQTWGIVPRIREADRFLTRNRPWRQAVFESHPELCFQALNRGRPLSGSKKTPAGLRERRAVLRRYVPDVSARFSKIRRNFSRSILADDDILDAFALAVSACRSETAGFVSLPENPPSDRFGLPMRIVYPAGKGSC